MGKYVENKTMSKGDKPKARHTAETWQTVQRRQKEQSAHWGQNTCENILHNASIHHFCQDSKSTDDIACKFFFISRLIYVGSVKHSLSTLQRSSHKAACTPFKHFLHSLGCVCLWKKLRPRQQTKNTFDRCFKKLHRSIFQNDDLFTDKT